MAALFVIQRPFGVMIIHIGGFRAFIIGLFPATPMIHVHSMDSIDGMIVIVMDNVVGLLFSARPSAK